LASRLLGVALGRSVKAGRVPLLGGLEKCKSTIYGIIIHFINPIYILIPTDFHIISYFFRGVNGIPPNILKRVTDGHRRSSKAWK